MRGDPWQDFVPGVPNTRANSRLRVFSGANVAASNDDWAGAASLSSLGTQIGAFGGGAELAAAFTSVAAFGLASDSRDAAVLARPQAGSYTAQVSGAAQWRRFERGEAAGGAASRTPSRSAGQPSRRLYRQSAVQRRIASGGSPRVRC